MRILNEKKQLFFLLFLTLIINQSVHCQTAKDSPIFDIMEQWHTKTLESKDDKYQIFVSHAIVLTGNDTSNPNNYIYMQSFFDSRGELLYYEYPIIEMYRKNRRSVFTSTEYQIEVWRNIDKSHLSTYLREIESREGKYIILKPNSIKYY